MLASLGQPTIEIDIDRARACALRTFAGRHKRDHNVWPSEGTQPATCMNQEAIVTSRSWCDWLPSFGRTQRRSATSASAPPGPGGITSNPAARGRECKAGRRAPPTSIASNRSVICRSSSACAAETSESAIREAEEKIAKQSAAAARDSTGVGRRAPQFQDAINRLQIAVPLSLALIGLLLWLNFSSLSDTLLALSVIPMAIVGGILALFVTGIAFSVSAAIGFIALFGISVMDGILIISQYHRLIDRGMDRIGAVLRAGELQMRPVLMTCVIAGVGLVPAALSTGIGSQVQKPLAVVVVGGMTLTPLLILIVLPALIALVARHKRVPASEVLVAERHVGS